MVYAQKLVLALLLFIGLRAHAGWEVTANQMGFFGRNSLGTIYDWENGHSLEGSVGIYSVDHVDYSQVNLAYRYSRWKLDREDYLWYPMQVGIFMTRSVDETHTFRTSPAKYPSSDYYDQTALRGGFEFGTVVQFTASKIAVAYHIRVIDTGITAIYNNAHRDLQYYVSSALALRYVF